LECAEVVVKEEIMKQNPVTAAEAVITGLEHEWANIGHEATTLKSERQVLAYRTVVEHDQAAEMRTAEINSRLAELRDLASVVKASLIEARRRHQAAVSSAERAEEQRRAYRTLELVKLMKQHAQEMDRGAAAMAGSYTALEKRSSRLWGWECSAHRDWRRCRFLQGAR
jgi:hypothetical protein